MCTLNRCLLLFSWHFWKMLLLLLFLLLCLYIFSSFDIFLLLGEHENLEEAHSLYSHKLKKYKTENDTMMTMMRMGEWRDDVICIYFLRASTKKKTKLKPPSRHLYCTSCQKGIYLTDMTFLHTSFSKGHTMFLFSDISHYDYRSHVTDVSYQSQSAVQKCNGTPREVDLLTLNLSTIVSRLNSCIWSFPSLFINVR